MVQITLFWESFLAWIFGFLGFFTPRRRSLRSFLNIGTAVAWAAQRQAGEKATKCSLSAAYSTRYKTRRTYK